MMEDSVVSLTREGIKLAFMIGLPILLTGIVVGVIVSVLQTITQIQDQSVAFVLKILAMAVVFTLLLPWIIEKYVEFSRKLIENIPQLITSFL